MYVNQNRLAVCGPHERLSPKGKPSARQSKIIETFGPIVGTR